MEEKVLKLNGFNLHIIETKKFKFNNIDVCFTNTFNKDNYLAKIFLLEYLRSCSKKYSNNYKMKLALNDLYCAKIYANAEPNCGNLYTTISIKYFKDEFTEKGNEIKCLEFLKEILFNPTFKNTKENNLELKIIKNQLIDSCNYSDNSIKEISGKRFSKLFIEEDYYNAASFINKELIENITLKDLEKVYLDMINKDSIDLFIIGEFNKESIDKIKTIFESNKGYKKYEPIVLKYSEREKIERIDEEKKFKQSILKIGYRANLTYREYRFTYRILNIILGGNGLSSKLMSNIREKESLCYSIYSSINPFCGALTITAGISSKNYEKAKNLIEKEFDKVINGKITDSEIENAKLSYLTLIKDLFDRYHSILDYFKLKYFLNLEDIETRKKEVKSIEKEEVIELAKKFKEDCIYLLKGDDLNE